MSDLYAVLLESGAGSLNGEVILVTHDLDEAEVLAAGGWYAAPRAEFAVYRMERIETTP